MIEQAKGILAERLGVTPDEAFVLLRRYARERNYPLTELAGDVIRGTAPIAAASPPAPPAPRARTLGGIPLADPAAPAPPATVPGAAGRRGAPRDDKGRQPA